MGHCPRGLQRQRGCLVLPPPRSCQVAGLPVGGGRDGGLLRRRTAAVPRAGAVERPGPDPQGTHVRPDGATGQPRRGRQGVLVVPRRGSQPRLEPLALPLSTGGFPVRRPDRRKRPARAARAGVRAPRHRCVRRGPLLDRRGRLREGQAGRPLDDRARHQRRARRRDHPRAAHRVVPQHVELG